MSARGVSFLSLAFWPVWLILRGVVTLLAATMILLIQVYRRLMRVVRRADYRATKDLAKIQDIYSRASLICQTSSADKIVVLDLLTLFSLSDRARAGYAPLPPPMAHVFVKARPLLQEFLDHASKYYEIRFYSNLDRPTGEAVSKAFALDRHCGESHRLYAEWVTHGRKILNYVSPNISKMLVLTTNLNELSEVSQEAAIPISPFKGS
jgi:hypothetical protein